MTRSEKRRVRKMGKIVRILGMGGSVTSACSAVGVGTSSFYRWLEVDDWFDEQVEEARVAKLCELLEDLGVQAKGHYVTEEVISGEEMVQRRRWVSGRTSASKVLLGHLGESLEVDEDVLGIDAAAEVSADLGEVSHSEVNYELSGGGELADGLMRSESRYVPGSARDAVVDEAAVAVASERGEVSHPEANSGLAEVADEAVVEATGRGDARGGASRMGMGGMSVADLSALVDGFVEQRGVLPGRDAC